MKLQGKPKDVVQQLAGMLPIGKECKLVIGPLEDDSPGILTAVKLATQSVIKNGGGNLPDKRRGADSDYTPSIVTLEFSDCQPLDIILEDINDIKMLINGIELVFDWGKVGIYSA